MQEGAGAASENGTTSKQSEGPAVVVESADTALTYVAPSGSDEFWTKFKLAFALPWRRFAKGSVLTIKVCDLDVCLVMCAFMGGGEAES